MKNKWYHILDGEVIEVVEALNSNNERKWVKFEPVSPSNPIKVANILDKPNEVSWKIKSSHVEVVNPDGSKTSYGGVLMAGSICASRGVDFAISSNTELLTFPIDPLSNSIKSITSTITSSGNNILVNVSSPCWLGYVAVTGSINKVTIL